jgi:DNA-binding LacI/PurR family transcriptional regulator
VTQFVNPRLTTVRVKKWEMGQQAALMALRLLEAEEWVDDDTSFSCQQQFPTELVVRQST